MRNGRCRFAPLDEVAKNQRAGKEELFMGYAREFVNACLDCLK